MRWCCDLRHPLQGSLWVQRGGPVSGQAAPPPGGRGPVSGQAPPPPGGRGGSPEPSVVPHFDMDSVRAARLPTMQWGT